jgi:SPP1 family predicted phage head-tail adaptor
MGTPAGKRRDRITFKRASIDTDDYGGEIETWAELGKRWAWIIYGTGQERRDAAQLQATVPATFNVPRDTLTQTIKPKDQIEFDGSIWNITGAPIRSKELDGVDITAVREA